LRDRTQASTITPAERLSEGQRFEQSFAARLAEQGIRFLTLEQKEGADFLITGPSGDVAVELVSNVGRNAADTFWSKSRKMIDLCKNKGYKKGIIVSRNIVPARAARYTNEIVSIMTEQEFFTALPQEKRTSSG
jgi:hypothetical protein